MRADRRRARRLALACLVTVAFGLLTGCGASSAADPRGGGTAVFSVVTGLKQWWRPAVGSVLDVGVPALVNTTSHAVRLVSVSLVDVPRGVVVLNTYAYSYERAGHGVASAIGILPKENPAEYVSLPVSSVVAQPHQYAPDFVMIALKISHAGRYALNTLRIEYVTNGHPGWQYQNLDLTITISPSAAGKTSTT